MPFDRIVVDLPIVYQVDGVRRRQKTHERVFNVVETMAFAIRSCTAGDLEAVHAVEALGRGDRPEIRRLVVADGRPYVRDEAENVHGRVPASLEAMAAEAAIRSTGATAAHGTRFLNFSPWGVVSTPARLGSERVWKPENIAEAWSSDRDEVAARALSIADDLLLVDGILHTASVEPAVRASSTLGIVFVDLLRHAERFRHSSFSDPTLFATPTQADAMRETTGLPSAMTPDGALAELPWRFRWRGASVLPSAASLASHVLGMRRGGMPDPYYANPSLRRTMTSIATTVQADVAAMEAGVDVDEDRFLSDAEHLAAVAARCGDLADIARRASQAADLVRRIEDAAPLAAAHVEDDPVYCI